MPVTCLADPLLCGPSHQHAVAEATRMALEFDGYSIVDSELLRAEMLRRHQTGSRDEVVGGTLFAEASPAEQHQILRDVGADGVVTTTLTISQARGAEAARTVAVEMAVLLLDGELVWWSQCRAESGYAASNEEAIDTATRCAIEGSTLW